MHVFGYSHKKSAKIVTYILHFCGDRSGILYVQRKSQQLLYCYGKADWDHLRSLLSYIPWHCAFFDNDIDHNWACWKDLLFTAVDECIPKHKN